MRLEFKGARCTRGYNSQATLAGSILLVLVLCSLIDSALADTNSWISGGPSSWFTPANWSLGALPTSSDDVFITNNTTATVQGASPATSDNLFLENGGATIGNISEGSLTVNGQITVATLGSSGTLTLNLGTVSFNTLSIGANGTYSDTTFGTVILAGANATIQMAGTVDLVVNSQIMGTDGLIKDGLGTLTLSGDNTYSGGTTISAGTLRVGNGGTSGLLGSGDVTNNSALIFNRSDGVVVDNLITGTGSLTQAGTGTLTLTADNTYNGVTTISAGTLQVGNGGASGSLGSGDVSNNSALVFDRSDGIVVSNTISGTGSLTQAGSGTLTLTTNNNYTGSTIISAGTLQVGDGGTSGSLGSGAVSNDAVLVFDRSDGVVVGNVISGTGSLAQAGSGTLTLTTNNTYAGGTIISAGTLQAGDGGTSGSLGSGTVSNDAVLVFNRSDNFLVNNEISGTGSVVQAGGGAVGFASNNTYSGSTMISTGSLQIGIGGTSGSLGSGAVSNDASLIFDRSDELVVSNVISGAGSLTQGGAGTLTLVATNTYSGNTLINAGTLQVGDGNTSGSIGGGDISNNSALVFNRSDDIVISNFISGVGNLTQAGTGLLTLVNTNTYSGGTTISNGTLQVGDGGTSGSLGSGDVANNGALVFNRSDDIVVSNAISGVGSLTHAGAGTVALDGNNSYSGGTIINTGTLQVGDGGTSGSLGSGAVTNNGALVFDRSDGILVTNQISGLGSLTQSGTGMLILSNANTYSGGTWINNGGALAVRDGQALGSGDVNLMNGTLRADRTVAVNSNYTQLANGTLEIAIGNTNVFGQLNIAGTASLDGSLSIVPTNNFIPSQNDSFMLVVASNGVTGTFSTFTNGFSSTSVLLSPELTYHANDVTLNWNQLSFVPFAHTHNQLVVARNLDVVAGSTTASSKALIGYLDSVPDPTNNLPLAYDLIAPEELSALFTVSFAAMDAQGSLFLKRANELRAPYRQLYTDLYNHNASGDDSGSSLTQPTEEVFQRYMSRKWDFYVEPVAQFVNLTGDSNADGYDQSSFGVTVGLDRRISDQLVLGGAATYLGNDVSLNHGGDISADSGLFQVYGVLFKQGLHFEGTLGGGFNSFDTTRQGLQGKAHGNTDAFMWTGLLGGGYDWQKGPWSFGPQVVVQYEWASFDSFTESGSLAPLHIESRDEDALYTLLGATARYRRNKPGTWSFVTPEASIAWRHDYLDESMPVSARLASGDGNTFTVYGPQLGTDSVVGSVGITVQWVPTISTYLNYVGQLARTGYEAHTVNGGVRIGF